MPRSKFKRQYLYVSDAQYLTSNVDLSEHYSVMNNSKPISSMPRKTKRHRKSKLEPTKAASPPTTKTTAKREHHFLQLQVDPAAMQHQATSTQLNKNICLALDNMLSDTHTENEDEPSTSSVDDKELTMSSSANDGKMQQVDYSSASTSSSSTGSTTRVSSEEHSEIMKRVKELDLSSSASGSSSDSGVFPGHSSSTSSSTSSLAEVLADPDKCLCKVRYETKVQTGLMLSGSSAFKGYRHNTHHPDQFQFQHFPQQSNSDLTNAGSSDTTEAAIGDTNKPIVPREQFEFGQCALDWHIDSHKNYHKNKLVALISAGMTSGSDRKYVTDTVTTFEKLGYEVCVFIRRGVGGLKLISTKFFSPAKWHDFEAAVMSVRQQRPGAHLVAVGFSFGSIELCRYLSMSGKRSLIDAAFLISCPFDPGAGSTNMRKRALNRRIDAYLARNLGKQLYQAMFNGSQQSTHHHQPTQDTQLRNHNGSIVNLASLTKIKSILDFEANYNRVLQNYPSAEAYAVDSRLHDHLAAITTPTLCLSSEDDFMAPHKLLPLEQIKANKNLCMILTKRGGHMAFIDGLFWPKKPYFAQRIIGRYMEAFKESLSTNHKCSSTVNDSTLDLANGNHFDFHKHDLRVQNQNHQQHSKRLPTRGPRKMKIISNILSESTPPVQCQHLRLQMFEVK